MRTGSVSIYTSYVGMVVMTTECIMTIFANMLFLHFLHLLHLERSKIKKMICNERYHLAIQLHQNNFSIICNSLLLIMYKYQLHQNNFSIISNSLLLIIYKYPILVCSFYSVSPLLILIKNYTTWSIHVVNISIRKKSKNKNTICMYNT